LGFQNPFLESDVPTQAMKEVNAVSSRGFLISTVAVIVGVVALGTGSTSASVQDSGTGTVRISTTDDFPGINPTPPAPPAQNKSGASGKKAKEGKETSGSNAANKPSTPQEEQPASESELDVSKDTKPKPSPASTPVVTATPTQTPESAPSPTEEVETP